MKSEEKSRDGPLLPAVEVVLALPRLPPPRRKLCLGESGEGTKTGEAGLLGQLQLVLGARRLWPSGLNPSAGSKTG